MTLLRPGSGPIPAPIMIVGEAFGEEEERAGLPFVGSSGRLLDQMLHEAGIMRSECFVTNLVNARPPNNDLAAWIATKKKDITNAHVPLRDKMVLPIVHEGHKNLLFELSQVKPKVIVTVGNSSMWALTGNWGITKWRGSLLRAEGGTRVVATYHPAAILRQWDWRAVAVLDLRRARREADQPAEEPKWKFSIRPTFSQVRDTLSWLAHQLRVGGLSWIDFDLETRAGHIACAGLSWSATEAICIPFMCVESQEGYWPPHEETEIVHLLYKVLTHPSAKVRWQNGLYDAQYTYRHWHFVPRGVQDTMISQHTIFCSLPKSLAFQASMYCRHYVYWKDEGKTWTSGMGEDQLWNYNCVDCIRTREVGEVEQKNVETMGLQEVEAFQQRLFWPVLRAMQIGLRVDIKARNELMLELQDEIAKREQFFIDVLGHALNPRSPAQLIQLFYRDFGLPEIKTKAKKGIPGHVTCDDEALKKIAQREPILRPLVNAIADIRTLGVFLSTFVQARLDTDGRMRCSFNIAGNTEGKGAPPTYRLSSSENAFGSGANMQNIPSDKSKTIGKAASRGSLDFPLPNIRRLYIPDLGFTFFDMDLDRADLQVVVWESEEPDFKKMMRMGVDVHLANACVLAGKEPPPMEELVESHPRYLEHRAKWKLKREFAKVFVHGTNYGGTAPTMARHCGISVAEADRAQRTWFGAHPGIRQWHERTKGQVERRRVENRLGYRWHIFDRTESLLPEALAWIPQSTVACVINRAWVNIYDHLPEVQVLLQVHDSLAGQFPTHLKDQLLPRILEESKIPIPYDDPLIIPVGIKTSEKSWGECS